MREADIWQGGLDGDLIEVVDKKADICSRSHCFLWGKVEYETEYVKGKKNKSFSRSVKCCDEPNAVASKMVKVDGMKDGCIVMPIVERVVYKLSQKTPISAAWGSVSK